MNLFEAPISFEWDEGNSEKNFLKHGVRNQECEEIFFHPNKKIFEDALHSGGERRYIIIGMTKQNRALFIVFTVRRYKVRVISARPLNKKEYKLL